MATGESKSKQPAWWRNPRNRGWVIQVAIVFLVLWGLSVIFGNTVENLEQRGIKTGFAFMSDISTFSIPLNFSPFWEFTLGESKYWEVFIIGIQNTLLVALLGIPAATILGVIIGILRLSPNALLRWLTGVYVEIFRNTPVLLQLLLWAFAVFPPLMAQFPPVRESIELGGAVFNNTGFYLPSPVMDGKSVTALLLWLGVTVAVMWGLGRKAKKFRDETGKYFPLIWANLGVVVVSIAVYYFVIADLITFDYPVKKGLNYRGGFRPPIQLIILWFGLVVYTAAFIAECVRGGMLSVSVGQSEAAMALGLHRGQRIRLILLPQALRVIIPPSISQFLNLTKNSSLAVAVGYPDITNVWAGIALNQTGQSLIIIALTVIVYEIFSLVTAGLTHIYESRKQIKER